MDIFFLLLQKLMPLYVIISIGWMAGRIENVDIKSLAFLSIYVLAPITVIGYVMQMEFKPIYIGLPVLVYAACCLITFSILRFAKTIYPDNRNVLLTMCASRNNAGYFGLPLVIALFPPDLIGIYMFMLMGNIIFGNTVGYYIWMRGNMNARDAFIKVIKFPGLYAFLIGIILNVQNVKLGEDALTYWAYFKGTYIVIGMLIIGTALSKIKHIKISFRFISLALIGKFIVWPLVAYLIILIDKNLIGIFDHKSHQMFFILSIVPPAANITAFAAQLNIRPDKAATTILISTIIALISIPLSLALSGLF